MPIYWVVEYNVKPEKVAEYQRWLNSDEASNLFSQYESETGFKYLNTYVPILGIGGGHDAEDWFEVPNWAAVDKIRSSKAMEQFIQKTWDLMDQTKPLRTRVMRTAKDVKVPEPPKR